jgi:hypothetical protein
MQGDRQASSSRPRHSSEWRPTTVNRADDRNGDENPRDPISWPSSVATSASRRRSMAIHQGRPRGSDAETRRRQNRAVRNVEAMLRRLLGEQITITTALADDLDPVMADVTQLE